MNEIKSMLSKDAQEYYSSLYIDFQKRIGNPDNKFFHDYQMVCNAISEIKGADSIVDIGSGNCRWFNLFEPKVTNYFAIEVNKTALSLAPNNLKLTLINQNVFDEEFNIMEAVKCKVELAFFGFFLSHFSDANIQILLNKLKAVNRLIIVDSYWSTIHQERYTSKELRNIKRIFSATERVFVPKRFFDNSDIDDLIRPLGYSITKFLVEKHWFFCTAEK